MSAKPNTGNVFVKLDSEDGPVEFKNWAEAFKVEAGKKKCKNHFVWSDSDVKEDKTVPEEVFLDKRICPVGQEEEFARNMESNKLEALQEKFEKASERIKKAYKDEPRAKEIAKLANKLDDDIYAVKSGFEKSVLDLKTAGDQYDRKRREFEEDRSNAVDLLKKCVSQKAYNAIYLVLEKVGPKNAFKRLMDTHTDDAATDQYLNSVTHKMDTLVFSTQVGNVGDHLAWLDREHATLIAHGRGVAEGQIMNYLLQAIDRNKAAKAMYAEAILLIKLMKIKRTEAEAMFRQVENDKHIQAEVRGQRANYAGARFVNAFAGSATVQKTKKRPGSGGETSGSGGGQKAKKAKTNCTRCGGDHATGDCKQEVYCQPCDSHKHSGDNCWKTHPELMPEWLKKKKAKKDKVPSDCLSEVKGDIPETPLLEENPPEEQVVAALGTCPTSQNGRSMAARESGKEGVMALSAALAEGLLQKINTASCEECTHPYWGGPRRDDASPQFVSANVGVTRRLYRIIIDSGASKHMLPERWMLSGPYRRIGGKVLLGDNSYKLNIEGVGLTKLDCLGWVLHVPELSLGLLSVPQLDRAGYDSKFGNGKCVVTRRETGEVVLTATLNKSRLYVVDRYFMRLFGDDDEVEEGDGDVEEVETAQAARAAEEGNELDVEGSANPKPPQALGDLDGLELLHRRLGHASESKLKKGLKKGAWKGAQYTYEELKDKHLKFCPACFQGQMKAFPRGEVSERKVKVGEKFAVDYKGKFAVQSVDGYTGFYLFCDYASNYLMVFLVKDKSEETTAKILEEFHHKIHQLAKRTPAVMQCDYDTVLRSDGIKRWLKENEIKLQMSAPYTHWQNGKIERNVGRVMDTARTMMAAKNVPRRFWSWAVRCAVYVLNRQTLYNSDKTPEEVVTGETPDISHMVPFWSSGVYHKTDDERNGPLDYKGVLVRMVGYADESKNSYYVHEVGTNRAIKVRHDCVWDESILGDLSLDNEEGELGIDDLAALEEELNAGGYPTEEELEQEERDPYAPEPGDDENPYWSLRAELEDFYEEVMERAFNATQAQPLPPLEQPKSWEEAKNGPDKDHWNKAFQTEVENFYLREVFKKAPQTGRTMKTKLIYKRSRRPDGSIKYKVRLVAKGFSQIKGVNYNETYAPTTSTEIVLISLALSVIFGFIRLCFDVTAAFLEGKNDYPNFARLPDGFGPLGGQRVEVVGNFYGEKQGPKIWNDKLNDILLTGGFERCPAHPCLYRRVSGSDVIYSCVHVDDGLVVTNNAALAEELKKHILSEVKQVTFEKHVMKYIGIDVAYDEKTQRLKLSHEQYISDNWGDLKNEKARIPMCPSHNLRTAKPVVSDKTMLHDTGKFRFIADRARPDILVATGEIATGGDKNPSTLHETVSQRTKEYLSFTRTLGLEFGPGELFIFGYCDAAYITVGNCKSRLGGCIFLNLFSGAIRTFSKTDTQLSSVSHSSTEAEIKAIDEWCRELLHILDIVSFLIGRRYVAPVKLLVDNQSAIRLCTTLKQNHKVKHINVRITFIRELVSAGVVALYHVDGEKNVADMDTKPLDVDTYEGHRRVQLTGHNGKLPPHTTMDI